MTRHLDTIIELQHDLERLREAEQQLGGIPHWMEELDAEYRERKAEMEALEQRAEDAAAERRQAEGEIGENQEKLKRYQRQINEVSTQREYGALLHEIDTVKQWIADLEDQAYTALESIEEANRALDEQKTAFQELEERYQAELAKWEEEKPGIAEEADKLRGRVEVLRERLPHSQLAHFERLHERTGGRALAPIRKVDRPRGPAMWACGVCNFNVRPQALVEIQDRGAIVQCDSCKRILVLEPEGAEETAATAEA